MTEQLQLQPFTRCRTNLKGGFDIALGTCTYVHGPNKARKTSILDTIRLALTGKHSIGRNPSDLFELTPADHQYLDALLTGPSGAAHWRLEAPEGVPKRPKSPSFSGDLAQIPDDVRDHILAVDGIAEMLKFGKDRMREALMHRFGRATSIATPVGLNSHQMELWATAQQACVQPEVSSQLADMAKWFRARSRKASSEATACEKLIQAREAQLQTESAGTELLPDYVRRLRLAEAWERAVAQRERRSDIESRLTEARAHEANVQASYATWSPPETEDLQPYEIALADARESRAQAQAALDLGQSMLRLVALTANPCCPLCESTNIDRGRVTQRVTQRLNEREQQQQQATSEIARLSLLLDAKRVAQRDIANNPFEETLLAAQTNVMRLQAELDGVNTGLTDVPAKYEGPDVNTLRAEVERIKSLEVTRTKLFEDTQDMHRLRRESEACKVLERESAKLLRELLKDVQDTAEATVNKYMPSGFHASLVIGDKAVEWRVTGIDDRPHKIGGMSGSEFGALVVAVACAWTEDSPLRLVLLDDVDTGTFDEENFAALTKALKQAVDRRDITQVVIAGWRNDAPSGWHIVEVGE